MPSTFRYLSVLIDLRGWVLVQYMDQISLSARHYIEIVCFFPFGRVAQQNRKLVSARARPSTYKYDFLVNLL